MPEKAELELGRAATLADVRLPVDVAGVQPDVEPRDAAGFEDTCHRLEDMLRAAAGVTNGHKAVAVQLNLDASGRRVALRPYGLKVIPSDDLIGRLRQIVGPDHVRVVAETPA